MASIRRNSALLALAVSACAGQGPQPENSCVAVGLFQVASDGESIVAAGRTFTFLGHGFSDPRQWRSSEAVLLCGYREPHAGAPMFTVTNVPRNETLVVFERNGEQQ